MGIGSRVGNMFSKISHKAEKATAEALRPAEGTPRPLNPKDNLLALDNTAFRVNGQWIAEFVISVFDRFDEAKAHRLEQEISLLLRLKKGELRWSRIGYFVCVPRQNVTVDLRRVAPDEPVINVGPTESNGIMSVEHPIPDHGQVWRTGDKTVFDVVLPPEFPEAHNLTTVFGEVSGFGVISDIDDSIKISDVLDKLKLLKNTFVVAQGKPVPGMPQLYQALRARLANPTFFYLSASPWQLYPFLHDFVTTHYPYGQIILRSMSYVELSSFLVTLTIGAQEYKEDRMEKIHRWFPNKQFFCIGDSTQKDPEAYGATYRKYPGWIKSIWIRVVVGVDPHKEKTLNAPERFEKAFQGVPRNVWRTFHDPSELM